MRSSLAALALALGGCAAAPTPFPLFDAHVHLNDAAMQLALMDEYGVERAVVFWGRSSDNETVAEAALKHPGRFIPFASISPERAAYRFAWQREDPALVARLDTLLATGRYKGIGEISLVHDATPGFAATDFSADSKTMAGIMALARKFRVPVMVHCETSRAGEIEKLLAGYPEVPLIWAHGGYTGVAEARRMLERHPNLYYELSARTWPRHPRSPAYPIVREGKVIPEWLALIESMPHRFLVGTDASGRDEANERMKLESVRDLLAQLTPSAGRLVGGEVLEKLLLQQ